jgi:hypothetical protein
VGLGVSSKLTCKGGSGTMCEGGVAVRGQNNAANTIACTATVNAPAMRRSFRRAGGPPNRLGPPGNTGLPGRFSGGVLNVPLIATPESCVQQSNIPWQERGE